MQSFDATNAGRDRPAMRSAIRCDRSVEISFVAHPLHDAEALGCGAVDDLAAEDQARRDTGPAEPCQPLRAAGARDHAHARFGQAELGGAVAIRRSQLSASSSPPPRAGPAMQASVTAGNASIRSNSRCKVFT